MDGSVDGHIMCLNCPQRLNATKLANHSSLAEEDMVQQKWSQRSHEYKREKLSTKSNSPGLTASGQAQNLGVVFDSEPNFRACAGYVTKSALYHLKILLMCGHFSLCAT